MNDFARLRRGLRPSSVARLKKWATAIRNAYFARNVDFARKRFDWRDKNIDDADFDKNGRPIIPLQRDFRRLRARIDRRARLQVRRGGLRGDVYSAIVGAFHAPTYEEEKILRFRIVELAEDGMLSPKRAQQWAHWLGVSQIAKLEFHELCDPTKESQWSLLMAAVWIQWRDLRLVARLSPVSENFLPTWVSAEDGDGRVYRLDPEDDLEDAKPQLLEYLRSGVSPASGVQNGERRDIAPVEWSDLQIVGRYGREGYSHVMVMDGRKAESIHRHIAYERMRLSRDDLLEAFPPLAPTIEETSMTDDELRKLLRDLERDTGKRPPVRTWKDQMKFFQSRNVSKPHFENIWTGLYPNPKRGRPSNNTS